MSFKTFLLLSGTVRYNHYKNILLILPHQKGDRRTGEFTVQPNKVMIKKKMRSFAHNSEAQKKELFTLMTCWRFAGSRKSQPTALHQTAVPSCSISPWQYFKLICWQKAPTMTMSCFVDSSAPVTNALHCRWLLHSKSYPTVRQLTVFIVKLCQLFSLHWQ